MSYNKYPKEMKEAIIARMLEGDETVTDIQRDTRVGIDTLYRWRDQAKHQDVYKRQQDEWGGYIRPVTPDEIGNIRSVRPYAIYKGHKVALRGSKLFEKMAITPTSMDDEDYEETMKALGIKHEYNGEDTVFVPIKDLDIYERVKYYDRYEYFKGIYKPYKIEDYHVIIKDGELHRHKVE